jgi:hypothetical protein
MSSGAGRQALLIMPDDAPPEAEGAGKPGLPGDAIGHCGPAHDRRSTNRSTNCNAPVPAMPGPPPAAPSASSDTGHVSDSVRTTDQNVTRPAPTGRVRRLLRQSVRFPASLAFGCYCSTRHSGFPRAASAGSTRSASSAELHRRGRVPGGPALLGAVEWRVALGGRGEVAVARSFVCLPTPTPEGSRRIRGPINRPRHEGFQGQYTGFHRKELAIGVAAVFDMLALEFRELPAGVLAGGVQRGHDRGGATPARRGDGWPRRTRDGCGPDQQLRRDRWPRAAGSGLGIRRGAASSRATTRWRRGR